MNAIEASHGDEEGGVGRGGPAAEKKAEDQVVAGRDDLAVRAGVFSRFQSRRIIRP